MAIRKKTWTEKLNDNKDLPKIEALKGKQELKWGKGTMVIPAPMEVDAIMKKIPEGRLITINQIRSIVARKHNATIGCPITTGIFAWIASHAAEEEERKGKADITPWWRTLKSDGLLNENYPGGMEIQKKRLRREGHSFVRKGQHFMVNNFEQFLIDPLALD